MRPVPFGYHTKYPEKSLFSEGKAFLKKSQKEPSLLGWVKVYF